MIFSQVVAAWDTLNKVTEAWEVQYASEIVNSSFHNVPLPTIPPSRTDTKSKERPKLHVSHPVEKKPVVERGPQRSQPVTKRQKRSVPTPHEIRRAQEKWINTGCRMHHLWVNFHVLGWDSWVLAPRGFEAGFCAGQCQWPLAEHVHPSTHAIIQSIMNQKYPHLAPRTSCVATKFRHIQMLYVDDDGTIVLNDSYGDMQAVQCGCR